MATNLLFCKSPSLLIYPMKTKSSSSNWRNCRIRILDDEGEELPPREIGTIYFEEGGEFEYHNDPEKTRASYNDKGWSTLSDMGYEAFYWNGHPMASREQRTT